MRILHVITTLDPRGGGPAESVRSLMSYNLLGYTGEAVTLDDPDAPFLKTLDFPVHALGPVKHSYPYMPRLYHWLQQNYQRFDGVVVNGLWNVCGMATYFALKGKKRYMVFSHGMLDPYFKRASPPKHFKKWIYWVLVEYWVLRGAMTQWGLSQPDVARVVADALPENAASVRVLAKNGFAEAGPGEDEGTRQFEIAAPI